MLALVGKLRMGDMDRPVVADVTGSKSRSMSNPGDRIEVVVVDLGDGDQLEGMAWLKRT